MAQESGTANCPPWCSTWTEASPRPSLPTPRARSFPSEWHRRTTCSASRWISSAATWRDRRRSRCQRRWGSDVADCIVLRQAAGRRRRLAAQPGRCLMPRPSTATSATLLFSGIRGGRLRDRRRHDGLRQRHGRTRERLRHRAARALPGGLRLGGQPHDGAGRHARPRLHAVRARGAGARLGYACRGVWPIPPSLQRRRAASRTSKARRPTCSR